MTPENHRDRFERADVFTIFEADQEEEARRHIQEHKEEMARRFQKLHELEPSIPTAEEVSDGGDD